MKTGLRLPSPRAAFTLIEMLAVMVILGILLTFLIPKLMGGAEVMKAQATSAFLREIDAALAEYNDEFGSYPSSEFKASWDVGSNSANTGAESLVLHLWSVDWGGTGLSTDRFCNTDGDASKKNIADPAVIANGNLMELGDSWGNPIAYISRSKYGDKTLYITYDNDTGETVEAEVGAFKNSATGSYFHPRKYQLISAGEDGLFNTEDDITNFDRGDE